MVIEICTDGERIGVKLGSEVISVENNKPIKLKEVYCLKFEDLRYDGNKLRYKDIVIPLPNLPGDLKLLKLIYLVSGEASNELWYCCSCEIHVDTKIRDTKLDEGLSPIYSRFCGNYGLITPKHCIANETFAIFGNDHKGVILAYQEFISFIKEIGKILLKLKVYSHL
ncbi:hypothetical protein SUSAZ_01435 [Sulfolobus acidocaldarius SUSAZ]|nr:hypothetical protein SUSAZ_01435 [Sulfolobus acidocaldarius SUSAZ]